MNNRDNYNPLNRIDWSRTKEKAKEALSQIGRKKQVVDTNPCKLLVIINGHNQYSWPNAMSLYRYIRDKLGRNIDLIRLADKQDSVGKWTLRIVLEFTGNREHIESQIIKRAKTIASKPEKGQLPGGLPPDVKFERIE